MSRQRTAFGQAESPVILWVPPEGSGGPCLANAVPGNMWERPRIDLWGMSEIGLKAAGSSTDALGISWQRAASGHDSMGPPEDPRAHA